MAFAVVLTAAAVTFIAEGTNAVPEVTTPVPWSEYFFQSFYHMAIVPVLLMTIAFAWMARPSTQEQIPSGFRKFQYAYLSVWGICVAADWLQGPYVYALYSAYGFSGPEIAQLFVAGFGSSLVFGCIVGALTDRFGRKRMCLAYCVLYIVSCCTKHFNNYSILMLGRVTGGIATSMLFSCFECWLVSEHCSRHQFAGGLLSYMFGLMFTLMYCVAIVSGLAAQFVADSFTFAPISQGSSFYMGGYCGPFDLAIVCLIIGMILILALWDENYGSEESSDTSGLLGNLAFAGRLLRADKNMLLVGVIVSCFEGSMFAFVFNWTPALESKDVPPPHGVIFALFMMACMCGASVSTIVGSSIKTSMRLIIAFALSIAAFSTMALVAGGQNALGACFVAFLAFEFCCGLYFPSIGVMKSDVVPEQVRGTMYNIYRVPLNAVVVCLLLSNISMIKCFTLCAALMTLALLSMVSIVVTPKSSEEVSMNKPAKQV
jgi:MFS family permease